MKENRNLLINRLLNLYLYCRLVNKSEAIQRNVLRITIKFLLDKVNVKTDYKPIYLSDEKRNHLYELLQEASLDKRIADMELLELIYKSNNNLYICLHNYNFVLIENVQDLDKKKVENAIKILSKYLLKIYNKVTA